MKELSIKYNSNLFKLFIYLALSLLSFMCQKNWIIPSSWASIKEYGWFLCTEDPLLLFRFAHFLLLSILTQSMSLGILNQFSSIILEEVAKYYNWLYLFTADLEFNFDILSTLVWPPSLNIFNAHQGQE